MTEEVKAVKAEEQKAAPAAEVEVDYEAQLALKDAELVKVRSERENYKRGLLKAKGKVTTEEEGTEDEDDRVRRIVREEQLASKEAQLISEQQALLKSATTKIKELTTALQNRGQMPKATGSSADATKDLKSEDFWSAEQLAYFKKRNIDPTKAKENFLKAKNK